jgi:hypothetical protein
MKIALEFVDFSESNEEGEEFEYHDEDCERSRFPMQFTRARRSSRRSGSKRRRRRRRS